MSVVREKINYLIKNTRKRTAGYYEPYHLMYDITYDELHAYNLLYDLLECRYCSDSGVNYQIRSGNDQVKIVPCLCCGTTNECLYYSFYWDSKSGEICLRKTEK